MAVLAFCGTDPGGEVCWVILLVGSRGTTVPPMASAAERPRAIATGKPVIVILYSGMFRE